MKILHYALGTPPFRRGGMTQYCLDLMEQQIKSNNTVDLIWPGQIYSLSSKVRIKRHKNYLISNDIFCGSIEIINPIPVPLMDGIRKPKHFLILKDIKYFDDFFDENSYDVLHVHSFMGLCEEMLVSAKNHGIKLIFTSHDYFPLCPRCTLFNNGSYCRSEACEKCVVCNKNGLSLIKIFMLQSNLYKIIKESIIIKKLRNSHNNNMYIVSDESSDSDSVNPDSIKQYKIMKKRNCEMLDLFDLIIFNSSGTKLVYQSQGYISKKSIVFPVNNKAICDNKIIRSYSNNKVRFGFMAPLTTHKGYNFIRDASQKLWDEGYKNFEVHYFCDSEKKPYNISHPPYKYEDLNLVMNMFDVAITPSASPETFGFTVLEAQSYGVPTIVSSLVGSKDLIVNGKNGMICEPTSLSLYDKMKKILDNPNILINMNEYIYENIEIMNMEQHSKKIMGLYERQEK